MHGLDYQLKDLPADARRKVLEYADTIRRMHMSDAIRLETSTKLSEEKTRAIQLAAGKKTVTPLRGRSEQPSPKNRRQS